MIYKTILSIYSREHNKSLKLSPFKIRPICFFQHYSDSPVTYQITKKVFFHEALERPCLVYHLMKTWQIKSQEGASCSLTRVCLSRGLSWVLRPMAAAWERSGTPATEKFPHTPHPQICCHSTSPSLLTILKEKRKKKKSQTKPTEPGENTYPGQSGKAYIC